MCYLQLMFKLNYFLNSHTKLHKCIVVMINDFFSFRVLESHNKMSAMKRKEKRKEESDSDGGLEEPDDDEMSEDGGFSSDEGI